MPSHVLTGAGLLGLVRDVFGVSESVAARQLLETIGAFPLPADAALKLDAEIAAAINGRAT